MSACNLSLEVKRRELRPGEAIDATLVMRADRDVRADAVSVVLGWRTHGKGNRDSDSAETVELGPVELTAGTEHRTPIRLSAPNGPVSYRGTLVNVDWYLTARADVPWALDPKTATELVLLPAPLEEVPGDGYRTPPTLRAQRHVLGTGVPQKSGQQNVAIAGFMFMVCAIFLVSSLQGGGSTLGVLFALTVALVFGWRALKPKVARARTGEVEIGVHPNETRAGGRLQVEVRLRPPRALTLNAVRARLLCQEIAVSGSGTRKTTHSHTVSSQVLELSKRRRVSAGETVALAGSITVPEDAPPSFEAPDNKVRWTVTTELDIEGWPDLEDEQVLTVFPS